MLDEPRQKKKETQIDHIERWVRAGTRQVSGGRISPSLCDRQSTGGGRNSVFPTSQRVGALGASSGWILLYLMTCSGPSLRC